MSAEFGGLRAQFVVALSALLRRWRLLRAPPKLNARVI